MDQRANVEQSLHLLIGQPLVNAGRAADMIWFSFGKEGKVIDSRGNQRSVGEFSLHVQCAWRFLGPDGILVGSNDIYSPAEKISEPKTDFNWDVPGENRCDERIKQLFTDRKSSLVVDEIHADFVGGFKILFGDGFALEVFPNSSCGVEEWRLFQPGANRPHFVLKGTD